MDARIFADFHQMSNEHKASTLRQMSADAYQLFAEWYNAWMNEHIRNIPGPVDNMLARFDYWLQQHPAPIVAPDYDTLHAAYTSASSKPMNLSWSRALHAAYNYLLERDGIAVELDSAGGITLAYIPSATSSTVYRVNGACQCAAYTRENPCWHRACKRLLQLCSELDSVRIAA
jgi:hypothetical protein